MQLAGVPFFLFPTLTPTPARFLGFLIIEEKEESESGENST